MTIDEAIELLKGEAWCLAQKDALDLVAAVNMGKEALKLIRELRLYHNVLPEYSLPGETEKESGNGS